MSAQTNSTVDTAHSLQPYIREDLKSAQSVSFMLFVEAVFGVSPDTLMTWMKIIEEQRWFTDKVIKAKLGQFCRAKDEKKRYAPLSALVDRILALGRGALPGVPDEYPIDDICLRRDDPVYIQRSSKSRSLKKPDLLTLRQRWESFLLRINHRKPVGLMWPMVLTTWELKGDKEFEELLAPLLEKYDPSSSLTVARKASNASRKAPTTTREATTTGRTLRPRPVLDDKGDSESSPSLGEKRPSDDTTQASSSSNKQKTDSSAGGDDQTINVREEATGNAVHMLSSTFGTRLHAVNIIMERDRLWSWYYDASGIVAAQEGISITDDFEKFCAVIVAIGCLTPAQLGALPPQLKPPEVTVHPGSWPPITLRNYSITMTHPKKGEVKVTLKKHIFSQRAIVGRRTFLYSVETDKTISDTPGGKLIAKFSYQVETRAKEQDLLKTASDAGVSHLPTVYMSADLWSMAEGVREIFWEREGVSYENRILRVIIYARYLPLPSLFWRSPRSIPVMVDQMLDCKSDLMCWSTRMR